LGGWVVGWWVVGWLGGWGEIEIKANSAQLELELGLSLAITLKLNIFVHAEIQQWTINKRSASFSPNSYSNIYGFSIFTGEAVTKSKLISPIGKHGH
jgi:hypothetical protein